MLRAVWRWCEFCCDSGMAYRLKREESVSHGVKRLANKALCSALDGLRPGHPKQRDEAVHEGRKEVKKARALLELVRDDLGRKYEKDKQRLREAARPLSHERDAKILLDTFDGLRKRHPTALRRHTWADIRRSLDALAADATRRALRPASITRTLNALRKTRDNSRSWSLDAKGFRALRPGLKRSFKRARKALHRARAHKTPGNLHRWRKRVKTHWYHTRMLEASEPRRLDPYLAKLHDLETWLGDLHNLIVLSERIKAGDFPPSMTEEVARLCSLIEQQQTQLRDKALALGARVYAERGRAFVRRLERFWRAWRAES